MATVFYMNLQVPKKVQFIIDTFYNNGFEAYMVGGCIRDALLHKIPKDFDIATSAKPEETLILFEKTIPTGIQHGTITVVIDNENFEVTTYRTENEYKDNRHPEKVDFVDNIKDDLSRRDFTINAFAYNDKNGLLDFFNGKNDLKNKVIKSVGDSHIRFNEDALRMLRAVRFSAQLNFQIDTATFNNIKNNCALIKNISSERIRDELSKILLSENPKKGMLLLKDSGLLYNIIPEIKPTVGFEQHNPYHFEDVFNHILSVVEKTKPYLPLRLAALFHDIGKPRCFKLDSDNIGHFYGHNNTSERMAKSILTRLRFDNKTISEVTILIKEHMNVLENPSSIAIKRLINRVGLDNIGTLFDLQRADISSSKMPDKRLYNLNIMIAKVDLILTNKEPLSIKDLDLTGSDLITYLNLKPGKDIGKTLDYLLKIVLSNPNLNTKEILLKEASSFISSLK